MAKIDKFSEQEGGVSANHNGKRRPPRVKFTPPPIEGYVWEPPYAEMNGKMVYTFKLRSNNPLVEFPWRPPARVFSIKYTKTKWLLQWSGYSYGNERVAGGSQYLPNKERVKKTIVARIALEKFGI